MGSVDDRLNGRWLVIVVAVDGADFLGVGVRLLVSCKVHSSMGRVGGLDSVLRIA